MWKYNPRFLSTAYYDPAVSDEKPVIWIAKDPMGISEKEMNKTRQYGVDISNDNATINDKGDVIVTGSPPNYQLPPKM
uniref:10TM putative phosphate transporter extracellular tail domain-containing protein n=1 Tax=Panagrolaimus superbus TaxID=310955 RepID=A0A914YAD8_9BILA